MQVAGVQIASVDLTLGGYTGERALSAANALAEVA